MTVLVRRTFLLLPALLGALPAAALQRVYVANIGAGTVAIVDAERRTLLGEIAVGAEPDGIAASPDGATIYVANFADDSVSIIDTATETVLDTVAVGDGPVGLAVSPSGAEVWVTLKLANAVVVLDTATRAVAQVIPLREEGGPNAIAFTPDGARALVTRSFGASVSVIDTASRGGITRVEVGDAPNRIVVSPDGRRAYVTMVRGAFDPETYGTTQLAVIDLATLTVVERRELREPPTALALSPDGRTLYVAEGSGIGRFAADSLTRLGHVATGARLNGLVALADPPAVLGGITALDLVLVLSPAFGLDRPGDSGATVPVAREPYALVALPAGPAERLVAAFDDPPFGFKLDPADRHDVRITVDATDGAATTWTLVLRRADGREPDRTLAAGAGPLHGATVADLDGAALAAGASWELVLTVTTDGDRAERRLPFLVPDRQYALVPLTGSLAEGAPHFEMDGSGERFLRISDSGFSIFDATRGVTDPLHLVRLQLTDTERVRLSRDGRRAGVLSYGLSGTYDLATGHASLFPYRPFIMDLDAAGRWLVGFRTGDPRERYQLFDTFAGTRTYLSDPPGPAPEARCDIGEAQQARISADGSRVTFVTGLDLGLGYAAGCRVVAYEQPTQTLRVVTALGARGVEGPTLDDAGAQMGLVLRDAPDAGSRRASLIDVDGGAVTDLLGDDPAQAFDAVVSGDGRSVIVSSCADLDPTVGNADANEELFRLDLASGRFTQITDTRGGAVGCERAGGKAYAPMVSTDASVVAFTPPPASSAGAYRSDRNGFLFGPVRAVPVVAGNTPPKLEIEGATTYLIGEYVRIAYRSGDRDGDAPALFGQLEDRPLPAGAYFYSDRNDPQGAFAWYYPGPDDVGEYHLRLGAFDGRGGEKVATLTLSICRRYVDRTDRDTVISAIFDHPAAACGDADANGDGAVGAADLSAVP